MQNDHYELLGVECDALAADIKTAYRRAAKKHHPDHGGDVEVMKRITQANEVLTDPAKRASYDAARLRARTRARSRTRPPRAEPRNAKAHAHRAPTPAEATGHLDPDKLTERLTEVWIPLSRTNPWLASFCMIADALVASQARRSS